MLLDVVGPGLLVDPGLGFVGVAGEVAAAMAIDSAREAVCCGLLLSRTVTVKVNVPAAVGVPNTEPTVALIAKPEGKPLDTDQV